MVDYRLLHFLTCHLAMAVAKVTLAIRLCGERIIAEAALVRPIAVVSAHMSYQSVFVECVVRTHVATVRTSAGTADVHTIVSFECTKIGEHRDAELAREFTAKLHFTELGGESVLSLFLGKWGELFGSERQRVGWRYGMGLVTQLLTHETTARGGVVENRRNIRQSRIERMRLGLERRHLWFLLDVHWFREGFIGVCERGVHKALLARLGG